MIRKMSLSEFYLLGIAVQCLHFLEEYLTGFPKAYFPMFGFPPMSDRTFVIINLVALSLFVSAAAGLLHGIRSARVVVWLFAVVMLLNGALHPLLSLATTSYFPGTITAPFHFVIALALLKRLSALQNGGVQ